MTRTLYRCLVYLHPPAFRREFACEMLWIYDETAQSQSSAVAPLLLDGFVSLARQWFLRSGYWKILAALAGGLFPLLMAAGLVMNIEQHNRSPLSVAGNPELVALMRLTALTAVCLLGAVIFLVFWWRKLAPRRGV